MSDVNAAARVFEHGDHTAKLLNEDPSSSHSPSPPPKPLLIAAPSEEGEYPMLLFLHGYLLCNSFYSQLLLHVASHGFIVIAPQLYSVAGPDSTDEIRAAAATVDWLIPGLAHVLPDHVRPSPTKFAVAGHSRGGKVAFALALSYAKASLRLSALIGVDPVDGMDRGKQTHPPILTYAPRSFDLKNTPVMVIGSGLGGQRRNPLFPPCAPEGVSHSDFFAECCPPAYHLVAREYGHLDVLDDETKGLKGKATYCLCKNGRERRPMREFTAGAMVAFMKAYLEGERRWLRGIREEPGAVPVELSVVTYLEAEDSSSNLT